MTPPAGAALTAIQSVPEGDFRMKRHLLVGAALMALAALPACDAVRLPVFNPVEQEPAEAPAAVSIEPATPGTPPAEPVSDLPAQDETPRIDQTQETALGAAVLPQSLQQDPETPDASAPASAITLAQLNATVCGLPAGEPSTPTVGAVAGATELEEPALGAEAVNALAASLANFPGIVKLEPQKPEEGGGVTTGHCGALRIADHWLVTAAHCVDEPFEALRIIGDTEDLRSPLARVSKGEFAVCHAGYGGTANGYANDLALIRLSDEDAAALGDVPIARYGATEKPLAPANYPDADMAGWGLTHFGGKLSNDLLTARVRLTGTGPSTIYVASQGGAGPCLGDSGGPLYVTEDDGTKTAVGILSVVEQNRKTGQFCAGDYNGRYTNLQGYMDWMDAIMALCDGDESACR